jgi:acetoin utilization deacetylase AcuC-like enzyme
MGSTGTSTGKRPERRGGLLSGFLSRVRARFRLARQIGLWYHPAYEPSGLARTSYAPDLPLDRVELAVGQCAEDGLLRPGDLREAPLASFAELLQVHSAAYVEDSIRPETLGHIFALDPARVDVDILLLAQRRAVGGTVQAALAVAEGRRRVGFNLGGGFHHAEPDRGGGLCVYNDVAVAISTLRARRFAGRISVVDLDFHQGNGNVATFAADRSVHTYSIQGSTWSHLEAVANEEIQLPLGTGDVAYLDRLRATLPRALEEHRPALVFYIAGNDVLAGDPLGGFALSHAGVLERDRFALECVRAMGAGVVLTLAGGYSRHAWQCTANLLRYLLTGAATPGAPPGEGLRQRFHAIARRLDPLTLQRDDDDAFTLSEADILGDLMEPAVPPRILGFYSLHGIEYALERYGMLARLRQRGFFDLRPALAPPDPPHQIVRLYGRRDASDLVLLIELSFCRRALLPGTFPGLDRAVDILWVEWLLLQDPTSDFSLERPQLPGQEHPGLGVGRDIEEALVQACARLGLEGVGDRPARFHNALGTHPQFRFVDPEQEGHFQALRDALGSYALADASRLLEARAVRTRSGAPIAWTPAPHVLPLSPDLQAFFESAHYKEQTEAARRAWLEAGIVVSEGPAAGNI